MRSSEVKKEVYITKNRADKERKRVNEVEKKEYFTKKRQYIERERESAREKERGKIDREGER